MRQRVAGVVVFEADTAKRMVARYYDSTLSTYETQTKFERDLIAKAVKSSPALAGAGIGGSPATSGEKSKDAAVTKPLPSALQEPTTTEVVLLDRFVVLFRLVNDVLIAVVARDDQNDLLMSDYVSTIHSCLSQLTVNQVTKKKLYDRLDQVFLVIDESLEDGYLFESDPSAIVARIYMNETPELGSGAATPTTGSGARPLSASTAVREGIAAISRGDADSLRSVFAGAAQTFSSFLGR